MFFVLPSDSVTYPKLQKNTVWLYKKLQQIVKMAESVSKGEDPVKEHSVDDDDEWEVVDELLVHVDLAGAIQVIHTLKSGASLL